MVGLEEGGLSGTKPQRQLPNCVQGGLLGSVSAQ